MEEAKKAKILDENTARQKAEHYCAYQERSQQEVRDKLYEWGQYPSVVENIISQLIASNFLNEQRFALAYTTGKFRQNGWGKVKIKQGLKLKRVSDPLIKKALNTIDGDEYLAMLKRIVEKKAALMKEKDRFKLNYKLQQYALSRGFEGDLIRDVLNNDDDFL